MAYKILFALIIFFLIILALKISGRVITNKIIDSPSSYTACGCGCCGGSSPTQNQCLFHLKGDNLDKLIENDKQAAQQPACATMGCSAGITYKYCD